MLHEVEWKGGPDLRTCLRGKLRGGKVTNGSSRPAWSEVRLLVAEWKPARNRENGGRRRTPVLADAEGV